MISFIDPKQSYIENKEEILRSIQEVLESGQYILGQQVQSFEQEFAHYIGTPYGVGVATGTDALYLALKVLDIGQGDEVITVSHTATATVSAIVQAGATPIFADIDPHYWVISPHDIEKKITPRTKAIIPVHLYGQPCPMQELVSLSKSKSIPLIEDCAQAHGAQYQNKTIGSFGLLSCFSFYPTKNLGAYGDGGMIVTSDKNLDEKLRQLREYGWKPKHQSQFHGWNSRLDEIQAAILRMKLQKLDQENESRIKIAHFYQDHLHSSYQTTPPLPDMKHVYHLFVILCQQRDALKKFLEAKHIQTAIHYPYPVHQHPAYARYATEPLPITESLSSQILSLPLYPQLSQDDAQYVVEQVNKFIEH